MRLDYSDWWRLDREVYNTFFILLYRFSSEVSLLPEGLLVKDSANKKRHHRRHKHRKRKEVTETTTMSTLDRVEATTTGWFKCFNFLLHRVFHFWVSEQNIKDEYITALICIWLYECIIHHLLKRILTLKCHFNIEIISTPTV